MQTLRMFALLAFTAKICLAGSLSAPAKHSLLVPAGSTPGFEANLGQADPAVRFVANGQNGSLLLMPGEAWLTFRNASDESGAPRILRLTLAGGNPSPKIEGLDLLPGMANYFSGRDATAWHTNVPMYRLVKYHDVYRGVDLDYYNNQQTLEYDFIVQPGANPADILLHFTGVDRISLDANGDLLLDIQGTQVRQHKPVVYQEVHGRRKILAGTYFLHSGMQAGFQVGEYDHGLPLIIDPVLAYSTAFGGTNLNQALSVTVDAQDNVYVTGTTTSRDFPILNPYQTNLLGSHSAFIAKFDTNGAVVYSTYLGGGLLNDITITSTSGQGITVDANGDAFVTGYTTATNFPVKNAFQTNKAATTFSGRNVFITKLNSAGNGLVYSTYLGGNANDTATGIALDTNGDAIVTGFTTSTNFPTANALQSVYGGNGDGFVSKLSNDGSRLVYSTYLGGSSYENEDLSTTGNAVPLGAVAVDFGGNAYVTGLTYSTNFPVLNAFQPTNAASFYGAYAAAFVTKLDPFGNLVYSTYFGGRLGDLGRAIGTDMNGNVYFAGNSLAGDLPTTNAFQASFGGSGSSQTGDGFIAALDSTGTNLMYCTYLGGSADDEVCGIDVRPEDGAVTVAGFTESQNFPLVAPIQPTGYQGLFKSMDAGNDWGLSNAGLNSGVIYAIQIDPSNPNIVYALANNGCFKSTDGGTTWASASNGLGSYSPPSSGSSAGLLAMDPVHTGTLYVGGFSGAYKTTNGGVSWASASIGLPSFPDILTMTIDPLAPTNLYAGTYFYGIYKSTNAGVSWNVATNGLSLQTIQALAVDPKNSSNVFAGSGSFTFSVAAFKSTNGGASWNLLGGGLTGGAVNLIVASSSSIYTIVGDSFGYAPGSFPVLKTSTNGGLNWTTLLDGSGLNFTTLAVAPPAAPSLTIASLNNSDNIAWPASFSGYVLQSSASLGSPNWKNVLQTMTTSNGNFVVSVPVSGSQGFYRLFQTNTAAVAPPTLYLGTDEASGQGVLKSTDGGINWSVLGPAGDSIGAIAVSPMSPTTVYAGLNGGRDAFISTVAPGGQLSSSTYMGGTGWDQANATAVDFNSGYLVGSTLSSDFPNVAATKLVPYKVETRDDKPKPNVTTSDGPYFFNQAIIQRVQELHICPSNTTETVHLKAGAKIQKLIGSFRIHTGGVQGNNPLPAGLILEFADDDRTSTLVYLTGTPTTPGTTTVTLTYTDIEYNCSWSKTTIYIVE